MIEQVNKPDVEAGRKGVTFMEFKEGHKIPRTEIEAQGFHELQNLGNNIIVTRGEERLLYNPWEEEIKYVFKTLRSGHCP